MSDPTDLEEEASRRSYKAPYSHNHPIPTIQRYREHRSELDEQYKQAEDAQHTEEDESKTKRAFESVKSIIKNEDKRHPAGDPYPTSNRNADDPEHTPDENDSGIPSVPSADDGDESKQLKDENNENGQSATEKAAGHTDPRKKRKEMKHNKRDDGGREVTDPITHLPLVIRDSTTKDLQRAPENEPGVGMKKTTTGLRGASKSSSQLESGEKELQENYNGMQKIFPPPAFDDTRAELVRTFQLALDVVLVIFVVLFALVIALIFLGMRSGEHLPGSRSGLREKAHESSNRWYISLTAILAVASVVAFAVIFQVRGWLGKKVEGIWEDEVWDAARVEEEKSNSSENHLPESVAWMNRFLASVWPLVNPDLFASLVDMLEDVMQASLPKVIKMVSIDDLGQGSEAIRILGIRWLPSGAADQSVDEEGHLKKASDEDANDRGAPGQGEEEDLESKGKQEEDPNSEASKKKQKEEKQKQEEQQSIREGMEAEQGDFVNMELAFAYRARSSGKSIKSKAKNAHIYLKFYLPGGIFVPVWVELRGIIGTMRLRLQLTPDPPFVSLCTLTFLGQPRADISCVPLSKHLPNLMNVPLISSFVQASIDAALAEYVAPKSLTLDLKDMLVGDDFKKDTVARGVIIIFIKEAKGFKEGDGGIGPMDGSSDAYVTCSWGKFGKTISSTRIIEKDQHPKWHEWAYILVSPEELNADEKVRLQLWDSDKYTADDDLGRVEVDLKELMHGAKTKNKMCDREDRFRGQDPGENMPGTISWSVGYFAKTRITEDQLAKQTEDENIKTKEDLKRQVYETAQRKLREATAHDESKEAHQQQTQDYRERENALICSSPPDSSYSSGILSIQIHNITGLEVESLQKKDDDLEREDQAEQSDDLPSSYCTIILNHKKIYVTRTKPKNAKPFFNAGIEHFIRNWQSAEVMISCRDTRERENDSLLGIVYLPLAKVFEKRSQVMDMYPLVGGMGFGRVRISMIFRSIELQLPKELRGWDYGTLEIEVPVKPKGQLPDGLIGHRIKMYSTLGRVKLQAHDGEWRPKNDDSSLFIPWRNRYQTPLTVEFRKSSLGPDSTPAFAVFWLRDIPDEEERTVTMQMWKGGKENIKRATTCAEYAGLDENEKPLGEIEVTLKFWKGLSGYHKRYAQKEKNGNVRNVIEVLDTVNDEIQSDNDEAGVGSNSDSDSSENSTKDSNDRKTKSKKLATHTNQSDSSDNNDEGTRNPLKKARKLTNDVVKGHNDSEDGSRGVVGQMRDYKDHHRELHRKHRGIMQWRAARTAEWALGKARRGKGKVQGVFEHGEKSNGVEAEV